MAGLLVAVTSGVVASGTNPKTILQLRAPPQGRLRIVEWSITFNGTVHDAVPVLVELVQQTGFTGTSSPSKRILIDESADETPLSFLFLGMATEPAGTTVLDSIMVHPRKGFVWTMPLAIDDELMLHGGDYLGWRVTAAADVDCVVSVKYEE